MPVSSAEMLPDKCSHYGVVRGSVYHTKTTRAKPRPAHSLLPCYIGDVPKEQVVV
jgi:hypothetical protein